MAGEQAAVTAAVRRRRWQGWLGYLVGAVCLAWVLHDIRPAELAHDLETIRWGWIWPAVVFDILSYVIQGWRWRLLLRPLGRIPVLKATEAIYVGLFTNEVLPLRFGELVRAWLVARRMEVGFSATLPSLAVERLFDSVWLAAAIGVSAIFVPLPADLMRAEDILGAAVLVLTAAFLYLVFRKPSARPSRWRALRWLAHFSQGLHRSGRSGSTYASFGASLPLLAAQALSFWLVIEAYGLNLSFWAGAVVYLIVRLGTAVPNAPANVGTYQFFAVVGLTLFGVDKTSATGFSLIVFLVLTIPLWALGLVALGRSGTTLGALRREIAALRDGSQQPTGAP